MSRRLRSDTPEIEALTDAFLTVVPNADGLKPANGYADAAHGLIDAVFSMQANYDGVRETVARYAERTGVQTRPLTDESRTEHGIAHLHAQLRGLSEDDLTALFDSRAKSPSVNRTKALLVQDVAGVLQALDVDKRDTVAATWDAPDYARQKAAWTSIRGLGPVTFEYFRMNCGYESVKPDIMILRWVHGVIGRTPQWRETVTLMMAVATQLEERWGHAVSVRDVDHTVWRHQSGRT